ncbi:putative amidoligase enzyme-domain-containing protein [Hypoxylon sp. FL0543]|nr:putative amidoligase enzyme-domain-containing protein [Hypoxylon sp. FL0543]
MSSQDQFPRANIRTFGVELELLIPWLYHDEPDPHQDDAERLPGIIRLKMKDGSSGWEERDMLNNEIVDFLEDQGLHAGADSYGMGDYGTDHWILKQDPTIDSEPEDPRYMWFPVEITSPAVRATPEALEAIRYMLNLLCSKYRVKVNRSCGFHVHVGDGPELMPLKHIKRVIGFFWAADPLLSCLHPPRRKTNHYSQSMRDRSRLAHGSRPEQMDHNLHDQEGSNFCIRYLGRDLRYGEQPISWRRENREEYHIEAFEETREPGHFEPFFATDDVEEREDTEADTTEASPPEVPTEADEYLEIGARIEEYKASVDEGSIAPQTPYSSTRNRLTRRLAYPRFIPEDEETERSGPLTVKAKEDIGVFPGVEAVFLSSSSCMVDWLHRPNMSPQRPNYNITPYSCWRINWPEEVPWTIEFRSAEGTTSGEWAEMWARICVGLTHFAIHAPIEDYLSVLLNIDGAASGRAPYDIADLLDEVGLFAEAEYVQRRLMEKREEFRLEFVPDEES